MDEIDEVGERQLDSKSKNRSTKYLTSKVL